MPRAGPALIAGNLQEVDGVEAVIAELDLADRPSSRIGDSHGGADNAALIEWRVPRRLEPLRGSEDSSQGRTDILAEDIRHPQMRLPVMKRHPNGLHKRGHSGEW